MCTSVLYLRIGAIAPSCEHGDELSAYFNVVNPLIIGAAVGFQVEMCCLELVTDRPCCVELVIDRLCSLELVTDRLCCWS